jgi:hypothetical protein
MTLLAPLLNRLRRMAATHAPDADAALLDRFARNGDEDAFADLVARHGLMVWGVCCRVLGEPHDAEDAFQATFLVLARRAGSIRPATLAGWLYGVALRVARKARSAGFRRPRQPAVDSPESESRSSGCTHRPGAARRPGGGGRAPARSQPAARGPVRPDCRRARWAYLATLREPLGDFLDS